MNERLPTAITARDLQASTLGTYRGMQGLVGVAASLYVRPSLPLLSLVSSNRVIHIMKQYRPSEPTDDLAPTYLRQHRDRPHHLLLRYVRLRSEIDV